MVFCAMGVKKSRTLGRVLLAIRTWMASFRSCGFYSSTPSSSRLATRPRVSDLVPIRQPPQSYNGDQDLLESPIQSSSNAHTPPSVLADLPPTESETILQRLAAMERRIEVLTADHELARREAPQNPAPLSSVGRRKSRIPKAVSVSVCMWHC